MSSMECEILAALVEEALRRGRLAPSSALRLGRWLERADLVRTGPQPFSTPSAAIEAPPLPSHYRHHPRRYLTRSQRRREAREQEHRRQVDLLFGPRPLLPFERRATLDYEPST